MRKAEIIPPVGTFLRLYHAMDAGGILGLNKRYARFTNHLIEPAPAVGDVALGLFGSRKHASWVVPWPISSTASA